MLTSVQYFGPNSASIIPTQYSNSSLYFLQEYNSRMAFSSKAKSILVILIIMHGNFILGNEAPNTQFERNWCRERTMRTDWRAYTQWCPGYARHWAYDVWADNFRTHPNLSYISGAEIKPAGHFSKVYIQTVTILNHTKTFGGDTWRVRVKGPSNLTASVYDLENGTYQAVFLPLEPGNYSLEVVLDYTLCHGLKNPPDDWFRKGEISLFSLIHVRSYCKRY